jgi:hypothetical protein
MENFNTSPEAGQERTSLDKALARLRTMSLVGHAMKCAGLFDKDDRFEITFSELSEKLSLAQYSDKESRWQCGDENDADGFGQARLRRWILGPNSAGWNLDATLNIWNRGAYAGSIDAFRHGPANSLLFDALAKPIESEEFFRAADTSFGQLCVQIGKSRHFSARVRSHLDDIKDDIHTDAESVMKYLAAAVAWFRYTNVTLHSLDYVLRHLHLAMEACDRIERHVLVGEGGIVSYPVNMNEFRSYLIKMTMNSARFRNRLPNLAAPENGTDLRVYWGDISKGLVA